MGAVGPIKTINFPLATAIAPGDEFIVNQGGKTKRAPVSLLDIEPGPTPDDEPVVVDADDEDTRLFFDLSDVTPGTDITLAVPNQDGTLALLESPNVFTQPQSAPGAGTDSERWGAGATAAGGGSTALGNTATASGTDSLAFGWHANASGTLATAIGYGAAATSTYTFAVGWGASAGTSGAIALGTSAVASGSGSLAVGNFASATGTDAVVLGVSSTASHQNSAVLGTLLSSTSTNQTLIGSSYPGSQGHRLSIAGSTSAWPSPLFRVMMELVLTWTDSTDLTRSPALQATLSDAVADCPYLGAWCESGVAYVSLSAPAAAPTDANLASGQITPYLDETGDNLYFRVRYSDGTLKTAGPFALT